MKREELAVSYSAGKLDREKSAAWEHHLAQCLDCRKLSQGQNSVWASLDEWEAPSVSPAFDRQLYEKIERNRSSAWWRRLMPVRVAMPLAVTCAALLAALLIQPVPQREPGPQAKADAVEIEQVDQALEDLEMLKQLSAVAHGDSQQL